MSRKRPSPTTTEDVSEWYTGHNRYLLESLLVFSLRRGFIEASWMIVSEMRKCGIQLSSMTLWCFNAQSKRLLDISKKIGNPELSIIIEEVSNAAVALSIAAGPDSPYVKPLQRYMSHADKVLMYLSLESFKEDQLAEVIVKLNKKFPPHSADSEVQFFRAEFAKILSSLDEIRRFVSQDWLPSREAAFQVLFKEAQNVAQHLPLTCIDQVGTRHHELFVQAVSKTDTQLGRILLSTFMDEANGNITESKLLQIMSTLESH
ncbi:unnamed protein product [Rodentolepis nana]|uniref:Uncharacterized protein n=1 Tax=Rodentolepis nana TaxID=102285 RepID=A0A0R3TRE0_RODNA|nr:unnamed protein product [Rodentolepis nana]